jgi:hypothetical protein
MFTPFLKPLTFSTALPRLAIFTLILAATACTYTGTISVNNTGTQGNGDSSAVSASADGRFYVFASRANNLVSSDTNNRSDIFLRDEVANVTTRVSLDSAGNEGNDDSFFPCVSDDGRYIAFWSEASNLVAADTNNVRDVFVHDSLTNTTTRVSVDSAGNEANGVVTGSLNSDISADGRYVAFRSDSTNLVANDTNSSWDIYVHDRNTAATTRVSVDAVGIEGDDHSFTPKLTDDGRYVTFTSGASNFVAGDTNATTDIFVHDRNTGAIERVSVDSAGNEANGGNFNPEITPDSRYVVFSSFASTLVSDDTALWGDVFVHDRNTGITERVSVDSAGNQGTGSSSLPSISNDGRYAAFSSHASNLVSNDTNGEQDTFLHDRNTGITTRLSEDSGGVQGNGSSRAPIFTAQSRYVAFSSEANNLIASDGNSREDIFLRAIPLISVTSVIPNMLPIAATTSVTISGSNFLPSTNLALGGAQLSNLVVVDENTITVDVTVPAGTTTGSRHLVTMLYGTTLGNDTGSAAICTSCLTYF